jgi:hypothetical protein
MNNPISELVNKARPLTQDELKELIEELKDIWERRKTDSSWGR